MMRFGAVAMVGMLANAAPALADTTELMFCAIENSSKMVSVRLDGPDVVYAFGNLNEMSDLILTTPAADVGYQPWPGVGSWIWETITFYNGDYSYMVTMSVERKNNPRKSGSIIVSRGEEEIAVLDCRPSSVSFDAVSPLSEIKREAGWCVDRGPKGGWTRCD